MPVQRLWLTDFRNYHSLDISLPDGLTVIIGNNGQGKTNLLESISWLSKGASFRGAPTEALVRNKKEKAIIRAEVFVNNRKVLLEAELLELKANPNKKASGTVVESELDKGRGYLTTIMVQGGTLKKGDIVLAGAQHGKVKALFDGWTIITQDKKPSAHFEHNIAVINNEPVILSTFDYIENESNS